MTTRQDNPWFSRSAALTPEKSEQIRQMLASTADKHGYTIYGTGGYVRDQLMGYTPDDFDVAVYKYGMNPEEAKLEFASLFVADHSLPPPISYGQTNTQFVDIGGDKVEINNHGSNLEQEAKNRDYTVNALFQNLQDPAAPIIDITGLGIQDAKDKVLRSADPKDPARLFKESPERILRGIRFMASRGMEFEPATLEALKGSVDLLADTAKENLGREFRKMLGHKASPKAWRLATELGVAQYIVPEWKDMQGVEQRPDYHHLPVDQHTLAVLENVPEDLVLQLAAILHDTGKPAYKKVEDSLIKFHEHEIGSKQIADKVLKELGFPEDIRATVVKLVGEHMRSHAYRPEWSDKTVRKLIRDLGGDVDKALALAKADLLGGNPEKHEERLRMFEELSARIKKEQEAAATPLHELKPLLDGNEMQTLFNRKPGKWIGDAQKYLMDLQLEDPSMDKTKATEVIRTWLDSGSPAPVEPTELSHDAPQKPEGENEKQAGMAPHKTASSVMDPAQFDEGMWWVLIDLGRQRLAQSYSTEVEADAAAAHVAANRNAKVVVLTPKTISAAKMSQAKSDEVAREIEKCLSRTAAITVKPRTVIGTSGFGHDAWLGKFYPQATLQKDRISFYASRFSAVEITSTKHSMPPTRVLENWAAATPAGFVFSFCAPVWVRPSNKKSAEVMRAFMRRISAVGGKLGPIVIHIGELEQYEDGDAKRFFDSLPPHRYAVQVDSKEWQNKEVLDEMLSRGYAVVDTELGTAATDCLGWSYKRVAADNVVRLPGVLKKDNSNMVFVEDKSSAFPTPELMQALHDLGISMGPDGPLSMVPNSMGPGGGHPTGPSNSGKSSGTEVADGISLEPLETSAPGVQKSNSKDKKNTPPMSVGDIENNDDGMSAPFEHSVDGKTGSTGSTTSF